MIFCNKGDIIFRPKDNKIERLRDLKDIMTAYMNEYGITMSEILSTLAVVLETELDDTEVGE